MKLLITTALVLVSTYFITAQNKPVYIVQKQVEKSLELIAKNTMDKRVTVTLKLTSENMRLSREGEMVEVIEPLSEVRMVVLTPMPGKSATFKYKLSTQYEGDPEAVTEERTRPMAYRTVVANSAKHRDKQARLNVEKGIDPRQVTIFVNNECKRCDYAIKMLDIMDIDYKKYNTAESLVYNQLMWDALYILGEKEGRIKMPVITKNNEIYFSINDLEEFMKGMANK